MQHSASVRTAFKGWRRKREESRKDWVRGRGRKGGKRGTQGAECELRDQALQPTRCPRPRPTWIWVGLIRVAPFDHLHRGLPLSPLM